MLKLASNLREERREVPEFWWLKRHPVELLKKGIQNKFLILLHCCWYCTWGKIINISRTFTKVLIFNIMYTWSISFLLLDILDIQDIQIGHLIHAYTLKIDGTQYSGTLYT